MVKPACTAYDSSRSLPPPLPCDLRALYPGGSGVSSLTMVWALLCCASLGTAMILSSPTRLSRATPAVCRHAPVATNFAGPPRASPLGLETLRDLASMAATLRDIQQSVRPMAECGFSPEQRALLTKLTVGINELQSNMVVMNEVDQRTQLAVGNDATRSTQLGALGSVAQPEDLKSLGEQAQQLRRESNSQQSILLLLEEQVSCRGVAGGAEAAAVIGMEGVGGLGEARARAMIRVCVKGAFPFGRRTTVRSHEHRRCSSLWTSLETAP